MDRGGGRQTNDANTSIAWISGLAVVLILFALLVRALDHERDIIPTEPDDPAFSMEYSYD